MIRHSPCEFYLKFLITHPDGFSNDAIKERLFELGLDDLGGYYIEKLRKKSRPPTPFYPEDRYHSKSQRFLIKEGIQDLFFPDNDTDIAFRMLDKPRIKEFVESMLIAYAPDAAIAYSLTTYRRFTATPRAIEIYKKYFWNIDLLDSVQVRALIQLRAASAGLHADDDIKRQAEPLKRASWNDPRRSAAELPHSPLSAVMAQMRMGIMPQQMEFPKVLMAARDMAMMTVYEALCMNGMQDHLKVRNLSDSVRSMNEVLESVIRPDMDMREQLSKIALRTNSEKVPHIHKLSQGRHTVDLQPKVEDTDVADEPAGPEGRADGDPASGERDGLPDGGTPPEVPHGK
jgi:hypothetical protein